jgi:hypothetical protein
LGILLAELRVESLGLMRAFEQATEVSTVAMKEFTYSQERGDGLAIMTGIHKAKGRRENTLLTFRRRR